MLFRAEEAGLKTAKAIRAMGHHAILAPVTRIVSLNGVPSADGFDAILATSANAFASVASDPLHHLPVLAVGRTTAEAARRRGFRDVRMSGGDAAALVALVRLTMRPSARLLYLAGRERKPVLERALAEAGFAIETALVYAAEPVEHWPNDVLVALREGSASAALHFSRRSVELALTLAERHSARKALLTIDHYCVSEDVAAPLREAAALHVHVPPRPEEGDLLALLPPAGQ